MKIFSRITLSSFLLVLLACKNKINMDKKENVKTLVDICEYPEGIDISYTQNLIVVACWFEDNIILIDLNNEKLLEKIGVSGGPRSFGSFILN